MRIHAEVGLLSRTTGETDMQWNRIAVAALFLTLGSLPVSKVALAGEQNPDSAHQPRSFTPRLADMQLTNQLGQTISLSQLMDRDNNLLFAFFFTQCITICTTTTFALKSVEQAVPADTLLAMISIDPDNDNPEVLAEYAEEHRLNAPRWQLLTGEKKDLEKLQRSLASYRGNKMNHNTSIFVKKSGSSSVTEVTDNFKIIPKLFKQD